QPGDADAEREGEDGVRDGDERREEDAEETGDEEGDHFRRAVRSRSPDDHLSRLHAVAPALAEIRARKRAAAMADAHVLVIDDPPARHELLDQAGVLADVADRLVEAGEGTAAHEEVHEGDVARVLEVEHAATVFVTRDAAADERRREQSV